MSQIREVDNGGSAPRILCLDDYFMVESERSGRKVMEYEYDGKLEQSYRTSLIKVRLLHFCYYCPLLIVYLLLLLFFYCVTYVDLCIFKYKILYDVFYDNEYYHYLWTIKFSVCSQSYKKQVDDGFFPFIILDCNNERVSHFQEVVKYSAQHGFEVSNA